MTRVVVSADTAFQAKETADYSAWTVWAQTRNAIFLLHAARERCEFPRLKQALVTACQVWHPTVVLVEDRSSGQSLIQELRRETTLPIQAVKADKENRAGERGGGAD